jgi:hypothetical protein
MVTRRSSRYAVPVGNIHHLLLSCYCDRYEG